MKQKIYHLVEKGSFGSKINLFFDYSLVVLIVLNVLAIALDTLTGLSTELQKFLKVFEIVSIAIFTIEYLMRLYVSDITYPAKNRISSALKFMASPFGIIDLLAILPFYIPFIIKLDLSPIKTLPNRISKM